MALAGVTIPRSPLSEAAAMGATERMARMLSQFTGRIALAAIDRWPSTESGRWFPSESELRDLCIEIQRSRRPAEPPRIPAPSYERSENERAEMRRKLAALADWLRTGNTHGVPELVAAQRKRQAREAAAEAAGFASVAHWMGNKR